jgi:PIN domain
MPLPRTVLIDTSVFDQHAYHFTSPSIQKFVLLAQAKKLTLLLPDAIEREVRRHIKEESHGVQRALKKACREAPLINKWAHWPGHKIAKAAQDQIEAATLAEWGEFLSEFKVEKLGYDGIDMKQVMDWYDQQQPPFGEGEKRKEFPDAFAIASALAHAKAAQTKVAVLSNDSDLKKACGLHPELLHFPDLPTLTEAFIAEMKTQIAAIKAALAAHPEEVVAHIREAFPDLTFYPEEDPEGEVSDIEAESVDLTKVRVIAIEDQHCTIAFDADVEFSAYVEYGDPDTMIIDTAEDIHMPLFTRAGIVTETASISATITLEFDSEWKSILSVFDLELEKQHVTIETRPPIRHDDDDDPPEGFDEPPGAPALPTQPLHAPPEPPPAPHP